MLPFHGRNTGSNPVGNATMVSKAYPYMISAFAVLRPFDGSHLTTPGALDEYVKRSQAYGDELEEWVKVNARGKWRRTMLEFDFASKEDAAMFRLRVGDGSRAYSRLASEDSKSKLESSKPSTLEANMATKGTSKPSKAAKKPAKKAPAKKAAAKKGASASAK